MMLQRGKMVLAPPAWRLLCGTIRLAPAAPAADLAGGCIFVVASNELSDRPGKVRDGWSSDSSTAGSEHGTCPMSDPSSPTSPPALCQKSAAGPVG